MSFRCYRLGLIFFNIIYLVRRVVCALRCTLQLHVATRSAAFNFMTKSSSQLQNQEITTECYNLVIRPSGICHVKDRMKFR